MRVVAEILLALEPNNKLKQPLRIGNTRLVRLVEIRRTTHRHTAANQTNNHEKGENQRRVQLQTFHFREINITKDLIT